jgi:hypothetical protein
MTEKQAERLISLLEILTGALTGLALVACLWLGFHLLR